MRATTRIYVPKGYITRDLQIKGQVPLSRWTRAQGADRLPVTSFRTSYRYSMSHARQLSSLHICLIFQGYYGGNKIYHSLWSERLLLEHRYASISTRLIQRTHLSIIFIRSVRKFMYIYLHQFLTQMDYRKLLER